MDNVKVITQQLNMLLGLLQPSREKAMVSRWQEEIGAFGVRRLNRQKVLRAIEKNYDTMNEIIGYSKLPRSTCNKIVRRLLTEGVITRTKVICSGNTRSGKISEFRYSVNQKHS